MIDIRNRKDSCPRETVNTIRDILNTHGIKTHAIHQINHKDLWFSNRIEFVDFPGIGANGKGIDADFALASGYGEFIERIQSEMLLSNLCSLNSDNLIENNKVNIQTYIDIFNTYFTDYLTQSGITQNKDIEDITKIGQGKYTKLHPYYDVLNSKVIKLPDRFITSICGSNGLASGNTKEEAFVQGLGELLERYVVSFIYSNREFVFPVVPRSLYERTNSFKMIEELEKNGYTVIVKDCTLQGKVPVLGVLLINSTKTKYLFKLGADLDIDIALQRCITEMFQGVQFVGLKLRMKVLDEVDIHHEFWNLLENDSEQYKTIRDGSGKFPRSIFRNQNVSYFDNLIEPFAIEKKSNSEACKILIQIVKNLGKDIYIKDLSFLGFPTLRIYVPGISEIIKYRYGVIATQSLLQKAKELYIKFSLSSDTNVALELLNVLEKLVSDTVVGKDFSLSDLLGIYIQEELNKYGYIKKHIYYFMSLLALYLNDFKKSRQWIKAFFQVDGLDIRQLRLGNMLFEALSQNFSLDEFSEYLEQTTTESEKKGLKEYFKDLTNIKNGDLKLFICSTCDVCCLKSQCNYKNIKDIYTRLDALRLEFEETFLYNDKFYSNLIKGV